MGFPMGSPGFSRVFWVSLPGFLLGFPFLGFRLVSNGDPRVSFGFPRQSNFKPGLAARVRQDPRLPENEEGQPLLPQHMMHEDSSASDSDRSAPPQQCACLLCFIEVPLTSNEMGRASGPMAARKGARLPPCLVRGYLVLVISALER